MMTPAARSALSRFGAVPVAVAAALALRGLFWPVLGPDLPFLFMWPAVLLAAWHGGFRPGILATLTAAAAEAYLVFEPRFSFAVVQPAEMVGIALFALLGLAVSGLVERLHRARRKAEREVERRERLEESLREADRRKDEILAVVAHEVRGPLSAVLTSVQVLRCGDAPADAAGTAVRIIERQARLLARLADDLLDVTRVRRGKLDVRLEPVELTAVLTTAVEASRPGIEARGHDLSAALPSEPVIVQGDPARLVQVFCNLLSNSARCTPEGGRIWLEAAEDGGEPVVVVRDNGIGIPADMLGRLFEPFTQAHRGAGRGLDGLGIGLSLVRSLVELHGGTVEAHSEGEGRGSEFRVRLPALAPGLPPPAGHSSGEGS